MKKILAVKSETHRKLVWQSIKGKFHYWQKLELYKVVPNEKLH